MRCTVHSPCGRSLYRAHHYWTSTHWHCCQWKESKQCFRWPSSGNMSISFFPSLPTCTSAVQTWANQRGNVPYSTSMGQSLLLWANTPIPKRQDIHHEVTCGFTCMTTEKTRGSGMENPPLPQQHGCRSREEVQPPQEILQAKMQLQIPVGMSSDRLEGLMLLLKCKASADLQYIDDIILWGYTAEEVFEQGQKIIQIFLKAGFAIKQSKVKGPAQEVQFLGVKR